MIQHGKFVVFHRKVNDPIEDYSIELVVVNIDDVEDRVQIEEIVWTFSFEEVKLKNLKILWRLVPSNQETKWHDIVCIRDKIYRYRTSIKNENKFSGVGWPGGTHHRQSLETIFC